VIELRRKVVLKIALGSVFICSFILALMYPVISASHKDKIYFLMSPNPIAVFGAPSGVEADAIYVWVSVIKDSTYGSFTLAFVDYETYGEESHYYEYHWFTDNPKAGEIYAYVTSNSLPDTTPEGIPIEYAHDLTHAKIDIAMAEHQLNATISVTGKTLFTVGYWADTNAALEPRLEPGEIPQELSLSVEAYGPLRQALVTGIEVGDFWMGKFDYIDTELWDSSLLP
jgi:hypothetical protein